MTTVAGANVMSEETPNGAADPFTQAWTDMLSNMGMAAGPSAPPIPGSIPGPAWSDEAAKHMQRAFLDGLAKYCDDYMRSPQFLSMMKQSMDNSLAFKQQVDRFLADGLHAAQATTRGDVDDIVGLLRTIEERIITRLDALETRMDSIAPAKTKRPARQAAKPTPPRVKRKATSKKTKTGNKRR